ncbi:MAG: CFI-box-CTERM domain-containing protein, partial [Campylobacterota bacterium]|nr:CFI-box-CTERM domain-containing protein [Campylobacterota bacterium]
GEGANYKNIKVNATTAYITFENSSNLEVIDLSEKENPQLLTLTNITNGNINDIDIKAGFSDLNTDHMLTYLYLATNSGLFVFNVTDPSNISETLVYESGLPFDKATVITPYVYTISGGDTFSILYAKKATSSPKIRSEFEVANITDMKINQNFAYLISYHSQLQGSYLSVLDIEDQTAPSPIEIGLFKAKDISVSDGLGYIIIDNTTLSTYDMSKDYPDTKKSAKTLSYSTEIGGYISKHRADDIDTFYIENSTKALYNFTAESSLILRFNIFSYNSDSSIGTFDITQNSNSSSLALNAGEYYLQISSLNEVVGEYMFTLSRENDDYADTFSDATTISLGVSYDANITTGDRDIIQIVLKDRGSFTFTTDKNISSSLYYGDGSTLIATDTNATLSTTLNPGTYFVAMSSNTPTQILYTFKADFSSDDKLALPNGMDGISAYNALHILRGDRYTYIIENDETLSIYNHLLQKLEDEKIEDINNNIDFKHYCGEPFIADDKIFINPTKIIENGTYGCGQGFVSIDIENIDIGDNNFQANSYSSFRGFMREGPSSIDITDNTVVQVDNSYSYHFSALNSEIYKAKYTLISDEYTRPYGIFSATSNIEDIRGVENDGNFDFIAINDTLTLYETNPDYTTINNAGTPTDPRDDYKEVQPVITQEYSLTPFEGAITDMKIDRELQLIYITNENSQNLKLISYNKDNLLLSTQTDINMSATPNGMYFYDSKIYITFEEFGLMVYKLPLTSTSQPVEILDNVGAKISNPFTYDGSTFNYVSLNQPQVFFLDKSFVDGTTPGTYALSSSGSAKEGGGVEGCFIATAAYGNYFQKHVKVLRDFRDNYLLTNELGREFVKFYYTHSPAIASDMADSPNAKAVVRAMLMPIVYTIKYPSILLMFLMLIISGIFIRKYFHKKEVVLS